MGNHTGSDLGVDLFQVMRAAQMIKEMGDGYRDLTNTVDGTDSADDNAFASHETRAGGQSSPVLGAWSSLRDEFQNLLGTTQRNLYDTSIALDNCINEYASEDGEASKKLRQEIVDNNENPNNHHFPVPDKDDKTPVDVPEYGKPGDDNTLDKPNLPEGY